MQDDRLLNIYHPVETQPWIVWKTLNRLRADVSKTKANTVNWGYEEEPDTCECGEAQSDKYLLQYVIAPSGCTTNDLALANKKAILIGEGAILTTYWFKKNILNTYLISILYFIFVLYCIYTQFFKLMINKDRVCFSYSYFRFPT